MNNSIDLNDTQKAFKYKSNGELRFTYYIFKILQYPRLLKLMTTLANGIIKYRLPFKFMIKSTVFKIFCAGETIDEAFQLIGSLEKFHVKSVLDYVSEGEKSEVAFNRNTKIIAENIQKLGKETNGNFVSVKLSGLEDPDFLESINERKFPTAPELSKRFESFYSRVDLICKTAFNHGVIVYIDAEDRCMQDLFDFLVENMMEKYNKQKAVIFNTLQMYLKDRLDYIRFLIKEGEEKSYIPGIKLVRGAYVEKERARAKALGLESPVYDTKEETDNAFNTAVDLCVSQHAKADTCIATHNDQSTMFGIECIQKYDLQNHFNKVMFSQLFGMSDNLTFNLAAGGYNSSKYLPYGEVRKAIPYLVRRSEENSSMNGQVSRELLYLEKEIKRRNS